MIVLCVVKCKYKELNNKLEKDLPDYDINISNLLIYVKYFNDNKFIVEFYLKAIFNFILELDQLNLNKFNNKLDKFIKFLIKKIIKFDELFSNYNYSQLKQMFVEDKFDNKFEFDNSEFDNNEEDDDLFAYNDLNINFDDEDPNDN